MTAAAVRSVSVDLGQSKMMAGVVDEHGAVTARQTRPTPLDQVALLRELTLLIEPRLADDVCAIGIAAAPLVEAGTGRMLWPGSLPLEGFALGDWLTDRFGLPTAIANDANAAAVGEHRVGAGRGTHHMVLLTIGTGIGGGIIIDGTLYVGAGGVAAELGHMMLDRDGPACSPGCPGVGHLESLASGSAIDAMVREAVRVDPDGDLAAAAGSDPADARLAVRLAAQGSATARGILDKAGEWLGYGIANIVNIFNPEAVVISGGVSEAGELLLGPARAVVDACALTPARAQVRIVVGQLGPMAGLVGAGLLAFEHVAAPLGA